MPPMNLSQCSFFDPHIACPESIKVGSLQWLLALRREELLPAWLLRDWRCERRGRKSWPATVLLSLLLLRWSEEGMSRLASIRRAKTDASWRAAMGLSLDSRVPSERTVRDFEKFMRQRHPQAKQPRFLLLHEQIVRACFEEGIGETPVIAADSTPMWCYGAVLDTVRLLGDGLRMLATRWAQATRTAVDDVAKSWNIDWLTAKSTKGGLGIDWSKPQQRAHGLDRLACDVLRAVDMIKRRLTTARASLRKSVRRACERLLRVVRDDLEEDDEGCLVIARRVARDRLVSMTDPHARHGHKSRNRHFHGFKLHVTGDIVSGLITAVCVTPGNLHDSAPAHRLFRRCTDLIDGLNQVMADTAYGAASFRRRVKQELGITMLAPPPPATRRAEERFGKSDFEIDFANHDALCPNGELACGVTTVMGNGGIAQRYKWHRDSCDSCELRAQCLTRGARSKVVLLHPDEQSLREARRHWQDPETRKAYRRRSQCERLVHRMTRRGARKARAWGLHKANQQAHTIATTCNLALLAAAMAEAA